ncbi:MAG: hypothetical protein ACQKBV_11985 [Puniceicoccales bacterium]
MRTSVDGKCVAVEYFDVAHRSFRSIQRSVHDELGGVADAGKAIGTFVLDDPVGYSAPVACINKELDIDGGKRTAGGGE